MADRGMNEFLSVHSAGIARGNRFRVQLLFPQQMNVPNSINELVEKSIHAAPLPPSTLGTMGNVYYMGRQAKFFGDRDYQDWTISIYNDDNQIIRNLFVQWSDMMNAHNRNVTSEAFPDVASTFGTATLIQENVWGGDGARYTLGGIFPTNVGEVSLAWEQQNEGESFDVTFAVNWFENDVTS